MKIFIANNLYEPFARGGAEAYCQKLFQAFQKRGDEVFVVSGRPVFSSHRQKNNFYIPSFYYYLSRLPLPFRLFWHIGNIFNFYSFLKVFIILKKEKPDLLISNNLVGLGFLTPLAAKLSRVRHIHVLHDLQLLHPSGLMFLGQENILNSFFARIYQTINLFLFGSPSLVLAPSQWIINLHKDRGFFKKSKLKKLFNPIDSLSSLPKKNNSKKKLEFLFVGQLEKHKGVKQILDSFTKLLELGYAVKLYVVGDGSLLKKISSDYKSDSIVFCGRLNKSEVSEKMAQSDCLVFNSLCYENSPTVLYEAAAHNLFFLAPNFGGTSEIASYFCGRVFNPHNQDSFFCSIEKIAKTQSPPQCDNEKKALELSADIYVGRIIVSL